MPRVGCSCPGIRTRVTRRTPADTPHGRKPLPDVTRLPIQLRDIERTGSGRHERTPLRAAASRWRRRRCRGHTSPYIGSPEDASVSAGTGATSRSSRRPDAEPVDRTRSHSRASITVTESPSLLPTAGATTPLTGGSTCSINRSPKSNSRAPNALCWHVSPMTMNRNRWRTRSARRTRVSSATANDRVEPSQSSSSPPRKHHQLGDELHNPGPSLPGRSHSPVT